MQRSDYRQKITDHLRSSYLLSDAKIEEVLPRFMVTLQTLMNELEELSGSEDIEAINRAGHSMKGALLNLGLPELAGKAYAIEKYTTHHGTEADITTLVAKLKKELDKIT